ncbi:hypothetical protein ACFX13_048120 [Malus domestica]
MGLVDSGLQVFESITLIQPEVQHCGCLVDLLGQAKMVERLSGKSLEHSGVHVLLPNMYASTNQWDNVVRSICFMPFLLTFLSEEGNRYFGCGYLSHVFMDDIMLVSFPIDKHLKSHWFDRDVTH